MSKDPLASKPQPAKIDYSRRSLLKVGTAFAGGLFAASLPEVRDSLTGKNGSPAEAYVPLNPLESQENTLIAQQAVSYQTVGSENPIQDGMRTSGVDVRGGAKLYGTFSIETFCNQGGLRYTHEDAAGWLAYVTQFTPANFSYRDSGVQVWAYYEDYDNWLDTYGMDAVRAVYHSGHGGMGSNGVFYAPMGANWGGLGCDAISSNMRLGNEYARYIFWSTCTSLRVLDGQSPIKTWSSANLGWRMLFGFETVSIDSPDYGKFFWQEWNKNKSFSTAWLDASWRIYHNQAPSVVACGATAQEAQNRLYNERFFYGAQSSTSWYWWRWYYASTAARQSQLTLPQNLLRARLQPIAAGRQSARALANRFQLDIRIPDEVATAQSGSFRVADRNASIAYDKDGSLEVQTAKPNLSNRKPIAPQQATALAKEAVQRYGLDKQVQLVFDRALLSYEAGGTAKGSGQFEGPHTTGTIVQFRQIINGLPVITPGAGTVRVSIDNDGKVTNVHSSVRAIEQLSNRSIITTSAPNSEGAAAPSDSANPTNYEQMLAAEFNKLSSSLATGSEGTIPLKFTTVPGSTEIGYDIRGNEAVLIAQKVVEVNFGNGYLKRYWVKATLFE